MKVMKDIAHSTQHKSGAKLSKKLGGTDFIFRSQPAVA